MSPRDSGRELAPSDQRCAGPVAVASSGPFPRPLCMKTQAKLRESFSNRRYEESLRLSTGVASPREELLGVAENKAARPARHPADTVRAGRGRMVAFGAVRSVLSASG